MKRRARVTGKRAAGCLCAIVIAFGCVPLATAFMVVHHPIVIRHPGHHPSRYALHYEDVSFPSTDGLSLSAWYVPTKRPKGVIILCHGAFADRTDLMDLAPGLHKAGFAVLAFDFRHRGRSERKANTLGKEEVNDLLGAVEYVKTRHELASEPIGVIGASMGAAVAILAAARCNDIRAVVADSSYARLDHAVHHHLWVLYGPLKPLLTPLTLWCGERMLGFSLGTVSPEESIAAISPRPILLIHSRRDFLIWKAESERLWRAARQPKELWLTPRGLHARSRKAYPVRYREKVVRFFQRTLTPPNLGERRRRGRETTRP